MRALLPLALLLTPLPVRAATQTLIGGVAPPDAQGVATVELLVANDDAAAVTEALPDRIEGLLGAGTRVMLERLDGQPRAAIAPQGFVRVRYRLHLPDTGQGATVLALPTLGVRGTTLASVPAAQLAAAPRPRPPVQPDRPFFANLSAYGPIYAVYGPGTNSAARIQFGFQFQPIGRVGAPRSWADGIRLGYTQRIFWNLGRRSSPIRDTDYMPELFYALRSRPIGDGITLGGQFGVRHESNGRTGAESRSFNTLYVQPMAIIPLGDYRLEVGPRAWAYVGRRADNPDIARYRGNAGLFLALGREDGVRLATTSRLNPRSGKGAIDAELSYPLTRLVAPDLNLYLFGQGFAGFGEDLLDYNRRQLRLRVGIGITR